MLRDFTDYSLLFKIWTVVSCGDCLCLQKRAWISWLAVTLFLLCYSCVASIRYLVVKVSVHHTKDQSVLSLGGCHSNKKKFLGDFYSAVWSRLVCQKLFIGSLFFIRISSLWSKYLQFQDYLHQTSLGWWIGTFKRIHQEFYPARRSETRRLTTSGVTFQILKCWRHPCIGLRRR